MDCSLPGSSVHGILQARILEWVAIPFPRGSSQPRDQTHVSHLLHWQACVFLFFFFLPLAPPGKPPMNYNHLLLFVSMLHLCQICPLQDGCYGSLMLSYKTWLYLFLAVLGLCYSVGTFSGCGKQGLLSSCGARASRCWAGALNRTGFGSWVAAARGLSSCATQA